VTAALLSLADLLEDGLFTDGDWVESKDQDPAGDVRLIQLADVGDGVFRNKSARFLTSAKARELGCTFLQPGDILVARMPEPLGRACIFPGVGQPAVTAVDVCILRVNSARIKAEWLVKAINSPIFRDSMQQFVRGTTRQRISRKNLGTLKLELPSISQQARLSHFLEDLERKRGSGSYHVLAAKRAIEGFRQSVLAAACSGRLTADWREGHPINDVDSLLSAANDERKAAYGRRFVGPPIVDVSELPSLPDDWRWTSFGSLIVTGPQNGLYLPQSKYGSGTPIVRIEDYQLDWSRPSNELKRVDASDSDRERYALKNGDIVINRVNSPSHLGKALLVKDRNVPAIFESNMMRISVVSSIDPEYAALYLQSMAGRNLLIKNAKWAVNQASINQSDVRATPIALPPLDEQREIVRRAVALLETASKIEQSIASASARIDRSSQAVLAKTFRGSLVA
jgi:type I restriction enzyme, S subunit